MTNKSIFISLLIVLLTCITVGASRADDIRITTCDFASIQSAIARANQFDEAVIQFECDGIIPFTSQLSITSKVHLIGNEAITLDGTNRTRLFYVGDGASFTLENVTIQNGYATEYGGALFNDGGLLTVHKTLLRDNEAGSGGAIYNFGTMTITDSYFMRNSGGYGGVIYNDESDVTITNTYFYHNTSVYGAVAYNEDGVITLIRAKLWQNNTDTGFWGEMLLFNTENAVTDIQMSDIYASNQYRAVFNKQGTFMSSQTHYNYISCFGIGIIDNGGNTSQNSESCPHSTGLLTYQYLEVTDCDHFWGRGTVLEAIIIANRAGGTITFTCSGTIDFLHDVFLVGTVIINGAGNVIFDGGGISNFFFSAYRSSILEFNGLTFQNGYHPETEPYWGVQTSGSLTITNSTFINNVSDEAGGAIDHTGTLTIDNSVFIGNRSYGNGGAVNVRGKDSILTITNSTFTDNIAEWGNGGAVSFHPGQQGGFYNAIITNSTFTNNDAREGGAIWAGGQLTVRDSLFADNTDRWGSEAIRHGYSQPIISENTVYRNNNCTGSVTDLGGNSAENAEGCPQS